jgi:hypothetical protein
MSPTYIVCTCARLRDAKSHEDCGLQLAPQYADAERNGERHVKLWLKCTLNVWTGAVCLYRVHGRIVLPVKSPDSDHMQNTQVIIV